MSARELALAGLFALGLPVAASAYTTGDSARDTSPMLFTHPAPLASGGWGAFIPASVETDDLFTTDFPPVGFLQDDGAAAGSADARKPGPSRFAMAGMPTGFFAGGGGSGSHRNAARRTTAPAIIPASFNPAPTGTTEEGELFPSAPVDTPARGTEPDAVAPVPLPAGFALAGSGLVALFGLGRLRRPKTA